MRSLISPAEHQHSSVIIASMSGFIMCDCKLRTERMFAFLPPSHCPPFFSLISYPLLNLPAVFRLLLSSSASSPHPDVSGSHGGVGAAGLHRHHRQRSGHEVHQGGRQQPVHQDPHRCDWRGALPSSRWSFCSFPFSTRETYKQYVLYLGN